VTRPPGEVSPIFCRPAKERRASKSISESKRVNEMTGYGMTLLFEPGMKLLFKPSVSH